MATNSRQAIHAYLEDATFDAWRDFADENGFSVTSMLEAMGQTILDDPDSFDRFAETFGLIKKARRIDADRRRRGR